MSKGSSEVAMTQAQFAEIVAELEALTGRTFGQKWTEERFELLKDVDAESFRQSAIANLKTGKPLFSANSEDSREKS